MQKKGKMKERRGSERGRRERKRECWLKRRVSLKESKRRSGRERKVERKDGKKGKR